MHHLCEQALIVLRSIQDIDQVRDEAVELVLDSARLDDLKRVIGREYNEVAWFALDLEPSDEEVAARFRWSGDQSLIPYFTADYDGLQYGARDMGLGEFSVHFLFWILEQYRERTDLVLLLDEPDAFLPPIGVEGLLARLLKLCQQRGWRMIVSSHSEELISAAVGHDAFLLLRMGSGGESEAIHSQSDPGIADTLLARPPIERVLFVEDESAYYLARALLERGDRSLSRQTSLVWGNGWGYLAELPKQLPKPPSPEIRFAMVPDGDQRGNADFRQTRWPTHFLPTDEDPDDLFKSLRLSPDELGNALLVDAVAFKLKLDQIQGEDAHDWVNLLGDEYGRPHVLTVLAAQWVAGHSADADAFAAHVMAAR
jgi:hypothetical protein